MSLAIRTKRFPSPLPLAPADRPIDPPPPTRPKAEAPEQGERGREAPESRLVCSAEAPDAGVGRADDLEQEFTHGRSQS